MEFDVEARTDEVADWILRLNRDQIPFATSLAINRTALSFQERQREHQRSIFHITRPVWMDRAVKISRFARKSRLEALVEIAPPGGKVRRGSIITKFEEDEFKLPYRRTHLLVPTRNVLDANNRILEGWRPKDLQLRVWKRGPNAKILRGRKRTFMIRYNEGVGAPEGGKAYNRKGKNRGVIFERDGPDLVPLYVLRRKVDIDPELNFVENAQDVVQDMYDEHFTEAFDEALRTAR